LDFELRVQGLTETLSFHKSGSGLELLNAVAVGKLEYVRFLVEKKYYNPMQGDQNGTSALHVAVLEGNMQILKYFITERNCNPACPGPLGLTPLHLASQLGNLDMVKYLVIEQQNMTHYVKIRMETLHCIELVQVAVRQLLSFLLQNI